MRASDFITINSFKEFEEHVFNLIKEEKVSGKIIVISCRASVFMNFPCDALALEKEYWVVTSSRRALVREIKKMYEEAIKALKEEELGLREILGEFYPARVECFEKEIVLSGKEYPKERDYWSEKRIEVDTMIDLQVCFYKIPKIKVLC